MIRPFEQGHIDATRRRSLARRALAGYPNGPGAPAEATEQALARIDEASRVVLVEGISDQMALDATARRLGRNLEAEGVVVLPVGGAQALARFIQQLGPLGDKRQLAGLYDADEAETIRRAVRRGGLGTPNTDADMEALGFHVCDRDLEDELIRALGIDAVLDVVASQGDLSSFRTMQKQPAWRYRPVDDQLRRFLVSGAKRKLRYARLLVESLDLDHLPAPLSKLLGSV
ncbi:MAG: ATP-dependent endonuclease [Acidimicrobiia bacterium]|nr:ATP-dependent endonuclease [Acidimicrobiia bacterium]